MRSIHVPWRYAASTPSGTATRIDSAIVVSDSMSVGSMRSATSDATVFLKKNDSPKSPVAMLPSQTKNWVRIGWSRPSFWRMPSTSWVVAAEPAMIAAGSPGVRRSSAKTKMATTAMTGIVARRRLAM